MMGQGGDEMPGSGHRHVPERAVHGMDLIGAACARVLDGDGAAGELAAHHIGRIRLAQGHPEGATGSDADRVLAGPLSGWWTTSAYQVPSALPDAVPTKRPVVEVADTSVPEMLKL